MTRLRVLVLLAALALAGCGGEPQGAAPNPRAIFRARMERLIAACAGPDAAAAEAETRDLLLPDPKAWFTARFGAGHPRLAALIADYEALARDVGELREVVRAKHAAGQTALLTERFVQRRDPRSTTYQSLALEQMRRPVALYSVRMLQPGEERGWHLWSFAHVDGHVRFVGPMVALAPEDASEDLRTLGPLRIDDARAIRPDWMMAGD